MTLNFGGRALLLYARVVKERRRIVLEKKFITNLGIIWRDRGVEKVNIFFRPLRFCFVFHFKYK